MGGGSGEGAGLRRDRVVRGKTLEGGVSGWRCALLNGELRSFLSDAK